MLKKYKKNKTKNISFPIGGIGTGCIGLSGNGQLIDWEIFNRPNKNSFNGYTHFAIKANYQKKTIVKVLHGDTNENYMGSYQNKKFTGFGFGPHSISMAGFPHFKNVNFEATFPLAKLTFEDQDFPARVSLCAFNPFIPHDEFNSSLPAGFFEWEIENTADEEIEYSISLSVQNPADISCNERVEKNGYKGIFLKTADKSGDEIGYTDISILTDDKDVDICPYWYRGEWQDALTTFWNDFSSTTRLPERNYTEFGNFDHASMAVYVKIPPKSKKTIRFILAWNVPNQYNYWSGCKDENDKHITWKNYYATQFATSLETATYGLSQFDKLYQQTAQFTQALAESTLPSFVKDAITANLSVLHSPTVLRYEDGTFWAWEGCHEKEGSCEGTCQHVWNYAYAMPFLFPRLERSIRESMLKYAFHENGRTDFRIFLPLGRGRQGSPWRACVDGQMGEVIKCYREWKISGDTQWLKTYAPKIFKMIEFAWSEINLDYWDRNKDGVLEGRQHHTLDLELFGPSSWLQGFYLLALDCGAKIADAVGDTQRANEYREIYAKGKKWTNENLFNGEYYIQKVDIDDKSVVDAFNAADWYWNQEANEIKYQVADGCIIDQMLADWHAHLIGGSCIFDKEKKMTALNSLYKYNYYSSMREVTNMWRIFALNDEAGTVICSYPNGVRKPKIPISYCEETMTGFEYALAGLMIAEGMRQEGEEIVKAIRNRYDGEKRNPWNEIECGSNYARSMASFALLSIYSGFSFDMTENYIGFAPIEKNGKYFWSVKDSWGVISFKGKLREFSVKNGSIMLAKFGLRKDEKVSKLLINGEEKEFLQTGTVITFEQANVQSLEVKLV